MLRTEPQQTSSEPRSGPEGKASSIDRTMHTCTDIPYTYLHSVCAPTHLPPHAQCVCSHTPTSVCVFPPHAQCVCSHTPTSTCTVCVLPHTYLHMHSVCAPTHLPPHAQCVCSHTPTSTCTVCVLPHTYLHMHSVCVPTHLPPHRPPVYC